jgi:hypothetical protein
LAVPVGHTIQRMASACPPPVRLRMDQVEPGLAWEQLTYRRTRSRAAHGGNIIVIREKRRRWRVGLGLTMELVGQASGSLARTVCSTTNGTSFQDYGGSLPRPAELAASPPSRRFCLPPGPRQMRTRANRDGREDLSFAFVSDSSNQPQVLPVRAISFSLLQANTRG